MRGREKFCLQWSEFETSISEGFRELREKQDFFDVTLACEDNQIEAHRVIISACSSFFKNVLQRNPHQHPLLYLKGVKYKDLLSILNFMYLGEVNLPQEELNSFLAAAEDLSVKGLTKNKQIQPIKRQNVNKVETSPPLQPPKRRRKLSPIPTSVSQITDIKPDEIEMILDEQVGLSFQDSTLKQTNQNETAINDNCIVDETFESFYEEISDSDSLALSNIRKEGLDINTGTKLQEPIKLEKASAKEGKLRIKPKPVKTPKLDGREEQVNKSLPVNASATPTKKSVTASPKPRQTTADKCVEEKPAHPYKRFGSAWQCEQCMTLFSRKSYAIEHMEEENKKTSSI